MDILLIGGASSFMDTLIVKLSNNGHRVYLLTGQKARDEAVRYEADLINLLMAFLLQNCEWFVYFSSQEIFENSHADNISEEEPVSVNTFK